MFKFFDKDLDPAENAAICRIKDWVERSLQQRDGRRANSPAAQPSKFWQDSSDFSRHMRRMPAEAFSSLRLHTYHFDGDTYVSSYVSRPDRFERYNGVLRSGLPERYWISAPQACGEYGHVIDGRLVNDMVNKWQGIVRDLWHDGELTRLERIQRPVILEIGAGYGGLAHHFMTMFPQATYIIVDIPETLLFSASYLTLIHGHDKVQLVDQETPLDSDYSDGAKFLMVPNLLLPSLSSFQFDLTINMNSFQEMSELQVTEYLEFLSSRTDVLFSKNIDEFQFSSDKVAVTPILRRFFDLRPVVRWEPNSPGKSASRRHARKFAGKVRRALVAALFWPDRRSAGSKNKGGTYMAVPKSGNQTTSKPEELLRNSR